MLELFTGLRKMLSPMVSWGRFCHWTMSEFPFFDLKMVSVIFGFGRGTDTEEVAFAEGATEGEGGG